MHMYISDRAPDCTLPFTSWDIKCIIQPDPIKMSVFFAPYFELFLPYWIVCYSCIFIYFELYMRWNWLAWLQAAIEILKSMDRIRIINIYCFISAVLDFVAWQTFVKMRECNQLFELWFISKGNYHSKHCYLNGTFNLLRGCTVLAVFQTRPGIFYSICVH